MIVKNTYGVSVAFSTSQYGIVPKSEFTGSALQRKKQDEATKSKIKQQPKKDKEKNYAPCLNGLNKKLERKLLVLQEHKKD